MKPNDRELALLAVHLIPKGLSALSDGDVVRRAVKMAEQICKEIDGDEKQHACDLFQSDETLSAESIAQRFKENGWDKLTTKKTVIKYIRNILDSLDRDIRQLGRLRRTALRGELRNRLSEGHAERADLSAVIDRVTNRIRDILREVGFNEVFGERCNRVAEEVACDIVERTLEIKQNVRRELDFLKPFTPELFEKICVDSSYDEYCRRNGVGKLNLDQLFEVILYMDGAMREKGNAGEQDVEIVLSAVNLWPDQLVPGIKNGRAPFEKYLDCIGDVGKLGNLPGAYSEGVWQMERLWTFLRMRQVLDSIGWSETPATAIDEIRRSWGQSNQERRDRISKEFVEGVDEMIVMISNLVIDRQIPRVPMFVDEHPLVMRNLRGLLNMLAMARHLIVSFERLGASLNVSISVNEALGTLNEEIARLKPLSDQMERERGEVESRGESILRETLSREFEPGRVNARLLFLYAKERGLEMDLLTQTGSGRGGGADHGA